MRGFVTTAPDYAKMFRRNPGGSAVAQAIRSLTPWGGFGSARNVDISKISAFAGDDYMHHVRGSFNGPIIGGTRLGFLGGFGSGFGKGCAGSEDGLAADPIARVIGCPDCPGMAAIAGSTKYTICYWLKRPMGQIAALALIVGAGYLIYKSASGGVE